MENMVTISTAEYKELITAKIESDFNERLKQEVSVLKEHYEFELVASKQEVEDITAKYEEANNSMMFWYERYTKLEAEMKKLKGEDYEV